MILYLGRKYFIHSFIFLIALTILPMGFFDDNTYTISRGFFWGGAFGAAYTYYDFNNRNIWPLFDNLRFSKTLLFSGLFLCFQLIYFIVKPFI